MIFFYKILNGITPKYLFHIIPATNDSCIKKEWNKLYAKIINLSSVSKYKKSLLIYFKTDENAIFDARNPIDSKLLNRLRLNFRT